MARGPHSMLLSGMARALERQKVWLAVFCLAFVFRVGLFLSKLVHVVFVNGDSTQYMALAGSLVRYHVFGVDGAPKMNRTPGYPLFLALLYAPLGYHSKFLIVFAQITLDSIIGCLVVDIARRMRLGRPALFATAALVITCLYTSAFTFQIMTETLYTFALTLALWVLPVDGDSGVVAFFRDWKRALACGACLGFGVLVRPGLLPATVLFLGLILGQSIRESGLRNRGLQLFAAPSMFAVGLCAIVMPWMIRNYTQFPAAYRTPNESHATLLGQWAPSPIYRHFFTSQFNAWKWSCEEPFVMARPDEPPSVIRFVYPSESAEVRDAFNNLKAEMEAGDAPITGPTLDAFAEITRRRYAHAPRLYVTAPISRMLKLWVTPRIGGLIEGHSGADASRAVTFALVLYNLMYVVPGFLGFALGWRRRASSVWTLAVALVAWHTILHSLWFPDVTSRYVVPLFPLLCIGFGVTAQYVVASRRFRRFLPSVGEEALAVDASTGHSGTPAFGGHEGLEDRMTKSV